MLIEADQWPRHVTPGNGCRKQPRHLVGIDDRCLMVMHDACLNTTILSVSETQGCLLLPSELRTHLLEMVCSARSALTLP